MKLVGNGQEGDFCLIGQDTVLSWYDLNVQSGDLFPDAVQKKIVTSLQELTNRIITPPESVKSGLLAGLFQPKAKHTAKQGLYIHGSVGRGKSFLMDAFFLNLPKKDKLRVHFHGFMQHFHIDMKKLEGQQDALTQAANKLADKFGLICFDEFHVSDIADAMILGRILEILFDRGTVLVMTSNYKPDDLYPNGLARDRFLPAIKLINERLEICSLDGDTDYRLRALTNAGLYLTPVNDEQEQHFAQMFAALACGMTLTPSVKVASRRLPARVRTSDAVWFAFADVCGGNFGQADYLQVAERFTTIFISGVPKLGVDGLAEATRRFTWLVDILYDAKVKLVLLAEHPLQTLFIGEGGESGRTLSRLEEMQSQAYLADTVRLPQALYG